MQRTSVMFSAINFQDLLKLGNAAGQTQFINLCFFLSQRFSVLNDMLMKLQTHTSKAKLDHHMYDSSSQIERAIPCCYKS